MRHHFARWCSQSKGVSVAAVAALVLSIDISIIIGSYGTRVYAMAELSVRFVLFSSWFFLSIKEGWYRLVERV